MPISQLEFSELEEEISKAGSSPSNYLAPEVGRTYVVAISRDGCPACEKQKPKLEGLAEDVAKMYGDKVVFIQVHIRRPAGSDEESLRSKDVLGHYFYPTNLILFRTLDRGAIEFYRSVSPAMEELRKKIQSSVEIVSMIEKDAG